jgi:hypothetical protein
LILSNRLIYGEHGFSAAGTIGRGCNQQALNTMGQGHLPAASGGRDPAGTLSFAQYRVALEMAKSPAKDAGSQGHVEGDAGDRFKTIVAVDVHTWRASPATS